MAFKPRRMTQKTYALGDIHGQLGMLETALALVEADGGPDAQIVFLGDYVDRGPDSKGVIERLASGKADGKPWRFLKGNHDRMFEWFMLPEPRHDPHMLVGYHWLHDRIGGVETLASYGVDIAHRERLSSVHERSMEAVPQSHVRFLERLELSVQIGDVFFAHAGVRPGVPLELQTEDDLVWIREEFNDDPTEHGALVVHGHTPVDAPLHKGNHVNLDTGAGYGKPITAAVFEGTDVFVLDENGRTRLMPTGT